LKILFLVPSFPSASETFIVNQIADLIDKGHDVTIFSASKSNAIIHPKVRQYQLIEKTIFQYVSGNPFKRVFMFIKLFFKAPKKVKYKYLTTLNFLRYGLSAISLSEFNKISWIPHKENEYEVLHAHFGFMGDYVVKAKAYGFFLNSKFVLTFHGYDLNPIDKFLNQKRYSEILRHKPSITVNTPYLKSVFEETFDGIHDIHVLPVGLDTDYFKPKSINKTDGIFRIGFCGRIVKFKGVLDLPELALILMDLGVNDFVIEVVGDGNPIVYHDFLQKIKNNKLTKYFKLYGNQTQDELLNLMCNWDVFISLSKFDKGRTETQGLVIQEAQSMKIPVVAFDVGGVRYGIINNNSGFLISVDDFIDFSNKILLLYNDSNLRDKMGETGRNYIAENFDIRKLGKKLLLIYKPR